MTELDEKSILNDLAFLADVTEHLDQLNIKLQGANQIFSHMYDQVRVFARKLVMFCSQLETSDFTHFPSMSILSPASTEAYVSAITDLRDEFTRRFQNFSTHSSKFDVFAKLLCFSRIPHVLRKSPPRDKIFSACHLCQNYALPTREYIFV